jgi:hypothetical protein
VRYEVSVFLLRWRSTWKVSLVNTYVVEMAFCSVAVMATRMFSFSIAASAARFSADLRSSPDMLTVDIISMARSFRLVYMSSARLTKLVRAYGAVENIGSQQLVVLDLEVLEERAHLLLVGGGGFGLEGVVGCELDAASGFQNVIGTCAMLEIRPTVLPPESRHTLF